MFQEKSLSRNLQAIVVLFSILTFASISSSQTQKKIKEKNLQNKPRIERIKSLVSSKIPTWDKGIIDVPMGIKWQENIDFNRILESVRERSITDNDVSSDIMRRAIERMRKGEGRVEHNGRVIQINQSLGKVRYTNQNNIWKSKQFTKLSVAREQAEDLVLESMTRLGLPATEMAKPRIATQLMAGAEPGEKELKEIREMYRIVTISRQIRQMPVFGSKVQAVISNDRKVQRLNIMWPMFRLVSNLKLRPRESVVEQAVVEIVRRHPDIDGKIHARLAYAPASLDDEEVRYVPVTIISVAALPTPYQLIVPIAE